MNPTQHHTKTISYKDQIMNQNLKEYFGEEEADSFIDSEEEKDSEYLGDYDLGKFLDEE